MSEFPLPDLPDLLELWLDAATGHFPPLADLFIHEALK
jgi:hypothetical protein